MSNPTQNPQRFDTLFLDLGDGRRLAVLRYRVGMIFKDGEGPKETDGAIRHTVDAETSLKEEKLYIPRLGVGLGRPETALGGGWQVALEVPESVVHAPYGEIFFYKKRPNVRVMFGRFGEGRCFGFDAEGPGSDVFVYLRIYKDEDILEGVGKSFEPLFIKVAPKKGEETFYLMLVAQWVGDVVGLTLLRREKEEIPEFMKR